ncbi:substrate-binding domain-containing protein [Streptomyces sp. NBC_00440]|uniref:LysR substrate-binding domain-containing protein n=1 Tax=unclassified Streptomyces TaxID=2593676 RepID=UPI002E22C002|nr:substrate-binding domain-containing protein [Streptomyces sp. NBC_00932]
MPDTLPTATAPARTVRLGVHGAPHLAARIVTAAGHNPREVEFVPYDVADPFGPLREHAMDMMIVKYDPREPDIAVSRPVAFDGRALIVGAHHPLAGRDTVSIEEAACYDSFSCPGGFPSYVWDEVVPPRTPSGTPIRRPHPMTTVEGMARILATTQAVHVSFRSLDAVLPPHIRAVPMHDLPPAPVALARLRGLELPPRAAALLADAERGAR